MLAREARRRAQYWIAANLEHWPGLVAAYAVGGVTTMEGDETFPPTKQFDLRLIFVESSPMLARPGVVKESFEGLMIAAEICSVAAYSSVEQLLDNPEIAHQLTFDSLLYDPSGHLAMLQAGICERYAAQADHERNARQQALMPPAAPQAKCPDATRGAQAAPRR